MNPAPTPILQWRLQSKVGPIYLIASDSALRGAYWKEQKVAYATSLRASGAAVQILRKAVSEIKEYLDGKRQSFTVPLEAEGTEFQKSVWSQLRKIPYGKTTSYREIAQRICNDHAVRAVGTANGRNPLSIFVPCHRVIAASGKLAGYAGGVGVKQRLLEIEAVSSRRSSP